MRALRIAWRSLLLTTVIGTGMLLSPFVHRGNMPRRGISTFVTSRWHRAMARAIGIRVKLTGTPCERAALYVANHISWFDIMALGGQLPLRFLSKAEVRSWPLAGWLASRAGTLYIERGNHQATAEANRHMSEALSNDENVCLFPEGTTTDGHIRKFHGRLMQCAIDTGSPVQPVAISYPPADSGNELRVHPAVLFTGDTGMGESLRRMLGEKRIEVSIRLLEPIETTGRSRDEVARLAQTAVSDSLSGK